METPPPPSSAAPRSDIGTVESDAPARDVLPRGAPGPAVRPPDIKYQSKAVRLARRMRGDVADGHGHQHGVLVPEAELARRYDVSRLTLRRAVDLLVADGVLRRIPRRGTVVVDAVDAASAPATPTAPPSRSLRVPTPPTAEAGAPAAVLSAAGSGAVPEASERRRARSGGRATARAAQCAVLMVSPPDETLERLKEGIHDYTRAHGMDMRLILGDADPETAWNRLAAMGGVGLDGLLVLPYPGTERTAFLRGLAEAGTPVVEVERRLGEEEVFCVEPDSAGGMYRATHFLLERHRRPVYFLGLDPEHRADADRLAGYRLAMRDAGYDATETERRVVLHPKGSGHPDWWSDPHKWRPGYELAERLFSETKGPWSVACVKDYVAWGLYRAAEERGLSIGPEGDVAVVGFDDLMIARCLSPALTTMAQPLHEKGYQAAALLHRRMLEPTLSPVTLALPVTLVSRGSA